MTVYCIAHYCCIQAESTDGSQLKSHLLKLHEQLEGPEPVSFVLLASLHVHQYNRAELLINQSPLTLNDGRLWGITVHLWPTGKEGDRMEQKDKRERSYSSRVDRKSQMQDFD